MSECSTTEAPKQSCIDKIVGICEDRMKEVRRNMELQAENLILNLQIRLSETIKESIKEAQGDQNVLVKTAIETGKLVIYIIVTIIGIKWFGG